MKKVLVHLCCAHCAAYTVEHWRREGCDVRGLWYNPNIHPFAEHQRRLESTLELARRLDLPLTVIEGYDMPEYFRQVAGHEAERCRYCFDLRLLVTAETAREEGCDAFTTTLLISPHQRHDLIRTIGEQAAAASGIEFLYADLRKRYSDSRHITKPLDLYRQQYCGCLYSEFERYAVETPPGE
jgi:predicted adenine nucleotide alpha hydrolase (AANH) superfamily ATPase